MENHHGFWAYLLETFSAASKFYLLFAAIHAYWDQMEAYSMISLSLSLHICNMKLYTSVMIGKLQNDTQFDDSCTFFDAFFSFDSICIFRWSNLNIHKWLTCFYNSVATRLLARFLWRGALRDGDEETMTHSSMRGALNPISAMAIARNSESWRGTGKKGQYYSIIQHENHFPKPLSEKVRACSR